MREVLRHVEMLQSTWQEVGTNLSLALAPE